MPFQLTTGAIWGIGVGAFVLTLAGGLVVIVLYCRWKQRRQLAQIFSARERRLSGYPGGHLSITDEDVARMPGTRRVRNSNHAPSGPSRGWTAISSRESLPRRPAKPAVKQSQNTLSSVPVWPLPPRLTRSTGAPLVKLQASLPCTTKEEEKSPQSAKLPDVGFSTLDPSDIVKDSSICIRDGHGESTKHVALTSSALRPKPLFHSKQRSISAGLIIQRPEGEMKHAEVSGHPKLPGNPPQTKPQIPRSASLCSQQAGMVPTKPIPPLPFNVSKSHRFQNIKSLAEANSTRASGNSLLSGDTSILDDCISRTMSQTETSMTSTSMPSPRVVSTELGRAGMSDTENHVWRSSASGGSLYPFQLSTLNELQAKHEVRKSGRASIVQSLPRSASSGLSLSLSLAPDSSRNVSSTSLHIDKGLPSRTPSLMVPETLEGKGSRRGKSPASPLRNSTTFDSQGELKTTKKFLSTLQAISGNEGSIGASQPEEDLLSGENNIFQWDPVSPMQPGKASAIRGRAKGHLRQTDLKIKKSGESNVRISDIPLPGILSASSSMRTMSPETPEQATRPGCLPPLASDHALPRPPTRVTFDPQIISSNHPKPLRDIRTNDDSPTPPIFGYNLDNTSSLESLVSSPSPRRRSPIHHRQSGSNPNRLKPVFLIPGQGHWSIMNFDSSFTADPAKPALDPEPVRPQAPKPVILSPQPATLPASSPPYSYMRPIPPEKDMPTRRGSPGSSPIRGPRAAPGRRSLLRGVGKSSSYGITGNGRDLRKSVMALRRQNSEAQNSPLPEHRNYLGIDNSSGRPLSGSESGSHSVGDTCTAVDVVTEDEEGKDGGREQKDQSGDVQRPRRAVMMADPSEGKGGQWGFLGIKARPESPGTLYDSSGFLRE